MGMLAGLLGRLSIDGCLCAGVWSAVGGRLIKGCCVVDDVCFYPIPCPLPWGKKITKNPPQKTLYL